MGPPKKGGTHSPLPHQGGGKNLFLRRPLRKGFSKKFEENVRKKKRKEVK